MGRVVIVTGGTRGIGAAICEEMKEAGYTVIANYAHNDDVAKAFHNKTKIPVRKWDVGNVKECETHVKDIEKEFGHVDVLVNNAGITRDAMMHKMDPKDWSIVINTNMSACFNMSRAVIIGMRERGFGRIINISSVNAQAGQLGQTNYCASKAGVIGFTKALAKESASKGITVNCVAPGYADTDMIHNVSENIMQKIIAQIPAGRVGKPEEIAHCVVFLAAENSGFITGETLSVNGGHYMD